MLRHCAYIVTFVPSVPRWRLAETKPGARRTETFVASVRSSMSRCWFTGSTVNTLMRVITGLFAEIVVIASPRGVSYCGRSRPPVAKMMVAASRRCRDAVERGALFRGFGLVPQRVHLGERGAFQRTPLLGQRAFDVAKTPLELGVGAVKREFRIDAG